MIAPQHDPFGESDAPAYSWKDKTVGHVITLLVGDHPKMVQSRDFKTKKPAVWDDGNPKYSVVINGTIDGEEYGLWMNKPSAMFGAIKEATKAAGKKGIAPGDTLMVKFIGTKPTDGDPQKLYAAKLTPGAPPAGTPDPFSSGSGDGGGWGDNAPF